ncbi:MAG: restriction endonuclease subunit S, partial [Pseudonocardiaceae bacterium]
MSTTPGLAWPEVRVKMITEKIGSGKTPTGGNETYIESGVLFLRSQNIHFDGLRLDDVAFVSDETDREMRSTRVRVTDSLLNITGASIGRVARATTGLARANVNQHVCIVRPSESFDARYLTWCLAGYGVQQQIRALQVGGNRDGLNFEQVGNLDVPYPPIDEQRRIADFLDAETVRIDVLASVQTEARRLLLQRRDSGVFTAVTGGDVANGVPSKLVWSKSLPATWESVKLGHFARLGSGHTPSRSRPEWWKDCDIPWITTGEVSQVRDDRREVLTDTREHISEIGLANSAAELHPKGTVALCRTASAGYSAVMGHDMATSQDFVTWTCGPR